MANMRIAAAVVFVSMLCAAESQAQWYVSMNVGVSSQTDIEAVGDYTDRVTGQPLTDIKVDVDTGFRIGGAVGRSMGALRVEVEAFYDKADLEVSLVAGTLGRFEDSGDREQWNIMLNTWYDVAWKDGMTPYVGGGLGYFRNEANISVDGDVENDGAIWQIGAGMGFDIDRTMTIDAGYRFVRAFSKLEDDLRGFRYDKPFESHAFVLGLRWSL